MCVLIKNKKTYDKYKYCEKKNNKITIIINKYKKENI